MTITAERSVHAQPLNELSQEALPPIDKPAPPTQSTPAGRRPGDKRDRSAMISSAAVAGTWIAVVIAVLAIGPEPADPAIRPTLLLQIMAEISAFAFFGLLIAATASLRATAKLGIFCGAMLIAGHVICGLEGHVPVNGWVWPTQLMLVAGATAVSALALATRKPSDPNEFSRQ